MNRFLCFGLHRSETEARFEDVYRQLQQERSRRLQDIHIKSRLEIRNKEAIELVVRNLALIKIQSWFIDFSC